MRLRLVLILSAAASLAACAQASQPEPKTDDEKVAYALGLFLVQRADLQSFNFTDKEIELLKAGIADGTRDKPKLDDKAYEAATGKLQELHDARVAAVSKREKEAGPAYLEKAASEAGAKKSPSGLVYKLVKEGTGASPKATDTVKVLYEGRFVDGKVFDSSAKHGGEPLEIPLNGVIPCWTEGVQQMKVGGKAKLVCPPDIGYGEQSGQPGMRGNATLTFDVELLEIVAPGAAPPSPHDFAPPPAKK